MCSMFIVYYVDISYVSLWLLLFQLVVNWNVADEFFASLLQHFFIGQKLKQGARDKSKQNKTLELLP